MVGYSLIINYKTKLERLSREKHSSSVEEKSFETLIPVVNALELFYLSVMAQKNKLECLALAKHHRSTFVSKLLYIKYFTASTFKVSSYLIDVRLG